MKIIKIIIYSNLSVIYEILVHLIGICLVAFLVYFEGRNKTNRCLVFSKQVIIFIFLFVRKKEY